MPKNAFTPREQLVCGKLDELEALLQSDPAALRLVDAIRHDCERMESKLVQRKNEVARLRTGLYRALPWIAKVTADNDVEPETGIAARAKRQYEACAAVLNG